MKQLRIFFFVWMNSNSNVASTETDPTKTKETSWPWDGFQRQSLRAFMSCLSGTSVSRKSNINSYWTSLWSRDCILVQCQHWALAERYVDSGVAHFQVHIAIMCCSIGQHFEWMFTALQCLIKPTILKCWKSRQSTSACVFSICLISSGITFHSWDLFPQLYVDTCPLVID